MKSIFKFRIVILVFVLCGVMPTALAYEIVGLSNFEKNKTYEFGAFTDISDSDWFKENVISAYEYEMMNGKGNGKFEPKTNITLAESITVAVRIFHIYHNGSPIFFDDVEDVDNWYDPYINFATIESITTKEYNNYNKSATRAEFAQILARSISDADLQEINYIADGAIPDVDMTSEYADSVYLLYRAGILTGSDAKGSFKPDTTITRAEAAAIITRIIDVNLRKSFELTGEF